MSPAYRFVVKWARTTHLYLTLFALALLLFFAVTGFMLNHESWFVPDRPRETVVPCTMPLEWMAEPKKHELEIVERLRGQYGAIGALTTEESAEEPRSLLEIADDEIRATFKRPGTQVGVVLYRVEKTVSAKRNDEWIEEVRSVGTGELIFKTKGFNGFIVDLHRGKDTGAPWKFIIDFVAVVYVVVAATGLVMWRSLKGRGKYGWVVALLGFGISVLVVVVFELWLSRN